MPKRREKLIAYLAEKGLTPKQFAVDCGISEGGLRKWISGERTPRLKWILKIESLTNGQVTVHDW